MRKKIGLSLLVLSIVPAIIWGVPGADLFHLFRLTNPAGAIGGSVTIGGTVNGGTAGRVLYEETGPVLADSAGLTFTAPAAAATASLAVTNSDNTSGSSHARALITTGGASGGDPKTVYTVTGAQSYTAGIDNSNGDRFMIEPGTAFDAATGGFLMDSSGRIGLGGNNPATSTVAQVSTVTLSGTTQYGLNGITTFGTAATVAGHGVASTPNASGSFTMATLANFFAGDPTITTATVTRSIKVYAPPFTGGTNNATLADNTAFTGNYFLNQTGTVPSNFGGAVNTAQGSDIASASTINLDTATGNVVDVTGTTPIDTVTLSAGRTRTVRFTGSLTLTHGANLVLPSGGNIQTAAGDYAVFVGYASSVVRVASYLPATFQARTLVTGTPQTSNSAALTSATFADFTNQPSVSITPVRTGKYRIYGNITVYCSSTAADWKLRVNNSVGSATVNFSQEAAVTQAVANYNTNASIYMIATLTTGTAYTFTVQGQTSAGNLFLGNNGPSNGNALMIEEL